MRWRRLLSPGRVAAGLRRRLLARLAALSRRRRTSHEHHHHPDRFSEAELLARAEEFNRNAERHWQAIAGDPAGRGHVLNKPLSTVQDTGAILYRLGLVLGELRPGLGHTVLDFAAGSCWLSSYLNRLRCRTVAVDVSPTALELGRELFRLDPRHRPELQPQFLAYDGHVLPLPDEAVDRIVSFDAFHHVPNQDEVLAEFYRVLRPGGRVVFAEPGEGHSHTEQSLFEMDRFGVLENDLHLDDLLARARRAGFDDAYVKPYADPGAVRFSAEEWTSFMGGSDAVYPLQSVRESLRHFYVFVLTKGREVLDSRSPGVLRAEIAMVDPSGLLALRAGQTATVVVRVTNIGDTLWRHQVDPVGGYVMLGAHLHAESGTPLAPNLSRAALPRDVGPGETVEVSLAVPAPTRLGAYRLRLDMLDEWLVWFSQVGSATPEYALQVVSYADSRAPQRLGARLELLEPPGLLVLKPGARVELPLRLTNTGDTVWLPATDGAPGAVALGGHLLDAAGEVLSWDFFRSPLAAPVGPGESSEAICRLTGPSAPGRYRLQIDLVAEGICWFEHHGPSARSVEVEVTDEVADSLEPALLLARIELLAGAGTLAAPCGSRLRLPLRVRNAGNTLWRHAAESHAGTVALGGHLYDGQRRLLELDLFRTPLPRPVAPGEALELACDLVVPARPGRYVVELDMVDEGIAWFAQRGSPTVELEVLAG